MNNPKPYIIQPIPGKGMGVLATKFIKYGDLILSEPPLFTQSDMLLTSTILAALAPKSDVDKRHYLELANCHVGKFPPLIGIFKTNTLPCGPNGMGRVAGKYAIFLDGSRFNSSCVPNVNNQWNERNGVIDFWAVRDIQEGEELCITYNLGEFETRDVRRKILKKNFRFECQCAVCALSGDDLRASDERRLMLGKLMQEIGMCGDRPAEGMKKAKEALRLAREEGLEHLVVGFSYDAFQFCAITSDLEHAKVWISQASRAATCVNGPEGAVQYEQYLKSPKTHRSWGLGRRMTLEGPDE